MRPQTIGRVLGIGVRVAGRMAGQRLAGNGSSESAHKGATRPVTVPGVGAQRTTRLDGRTAARATGSLAKGIGGFIRPFRRVGGIVFLEVMGVFFLLFVLVFGQYLWRVRASVLHGPDHSKFLATAALMLLFIYLGVSSFWRARRK